MPGNFELPGIWEKEKHEIALCQMAMHWTIAENLENIKIHLQQAVAGGAQLAVFPECAVTGYHRELSRISSRESLRVAFDQFWISYIAWGDMTENEESKEIHDSSLALSAALGIPVINMNWANAVNGTSIVGMGGSRLIRNGKIDLLLEEDREVMEILDI